MACSSTYLRRREYSGLTEQALGRAPDTWINGADAISAKHPSCNSDCTQQEARMHRRILIVVVSQDPEHVSIHAVVPTPMKGATKTSSTKKQVCDKNASHSLSSASGFIYDDVCTPNVSITLHP